MKPRKTESLAKETGHVYRRANGEWIVGAGPATVHWGYFSGAESPILTVPTGTCLTIDTVSHEGLLPDQGEPAAFFARFGIARPQVLDDAIAIYASVQHSALGPHIVTGPVCVEEAEPGDVLAVEILEVEPRVPYGVNSMRMGKGVLPEEFTTNRSVVIPFDLERGVALFHPDIPIPLRPFFGILATAPPRSLGRTSSIPPGPYGGNLDIKHLVAGTTLYLPVHVPGALFMVGDGHAAQGNGEVNLTAIETSMRGRFRLSVHKGAPLCMPRAETPTHWITIGLHERLDDALRIAVSETIRFLAERYGLSRADAYAFASVGVDFEISQAVNGVKGVHALIPKASFAARETRSFP